jgi:hypothetical protein
MGLTPPLRASALVSSIFNQFCIAWNLRKILDFDVHTSIFGSIKLFRKYIFVVMIPFLLEWLIINHLSSFMLVTLTFVDLATIFLSCHPDLNINKKSRNWPFQILTFPYLMGKDSCV